jgi:hypothetical protein
MAFSLCGIVLAIALCAVSPATHERLARGLRGDTRAYQITIITHGDRSTCNKLSQKPFVLRDSTGVIGEVRFSSCTERVRSDGSIDAQIWLRVSTDRKDSLSRNHGTFEIVFQPDGSLYLKD